MRDSQWAPEKSCIQVLLLRSAIKKNKNKKIIKKKLKRKIDKKMII